MAAKNGGADTGQRPGRARSANRRIREAVGEGAGTAALTMSSALIATMLLRLLSNDNRRLTREDTDRVDLNCELVSKALSRCRRPGELECYRRTRPRDMRSEDPWMNLFELHVRPARWYSAWWHRLFGWRGPLYKKPWGHAYSELGATPRDLYKWVALQPPVDIPPRRAKRVA